MFLLGRPCDCRSWHYATEPSLASRSVHRLQFPHSNVGYMLQSHLQFTSGLHRMGRLVCCGRPHTLAYKGKANIRQRGESASGEGTVLIPPPAFEVPSLTLLHANVVGLHLYPAYQALHAAYTDRVARVVPKKRFILILLGIKNVRGGEGPSNSPLALSHVDGCRPSPYTPMCSVGRRIPNDPCGANPM